MSRWLPLESNPTVMNEYLKKMGMAEDWSLVDVYGIDEELLAMVPQPAVAVIFLFPITEKEEKLKKEQDDKLKSSGQTVPDGIYFMKQYVGNACGTVALIHAIANNLDNLTLKDGVLKSFLDNTKSMSAEDKGHALENDFGIAKVHENLAQEGQTAAPDREAKLDTHFIVLVNVKGHLYELDGRKEFPIEHGETSSPSFLSDATKVCGEFMKREPGESRFAMVALAKSD